MKWFKRKPDDVVAKELSNAILVRALVAEKLLKDAWDELTGAPLKNDSAFLVRNELCFFYFFLADNFVLETVGKGRRDELMEGAAQQVLVRLIEGSLDTSKVADKGYANSFLLRVKVEAAETLLEACQEYSACEQFLNAGGPFNEKTVIGKLCQRICSFTGHPDNLGLMTRIMTDAVETLTTPSLKRQVQQIIG